ncbi:MAG: hypothetical protein K6G73_05455 [Marinilabiliaceae bacterium]|nr:hypothetical protein [Marinilabiliaceae bacterium]
MITKKIFLSLVMVAFCVVAAAQVSIYKDGQLVLFLDIKPDSVVFDNQNIGGVDNTLKGNVPEGAIAGRFSVEEGRYVTFSRGNLQFQASTGIWRFAERQIDVVGNGNLNASSTYNGWIDLFPRGTSGWYSGANCYNPWQRTYSYWDYWFGGERTAESTGHNHFVNLDNLWGEYANADWGIYNAIQNGGNKAGKWRTLTNNEWIYLMYNRPNASHLIAHAIVDGVCGLILLPDDWRGVADVKLKFTIDLNSDSDQPWIPIIDHSVNYYKLNELSIAQFAILQVKGAVFLPAAGSANATIYNGANYEGNYWSSTANSESHAYGMRFSPYRFKPNSNYCRTEALSVRLVQDVK